MASPLSTSFLRLTEVGDVIDIESMESERPYSSGLEHSESYLQSVLDDGNMLGFRYFSKRENDEYLQVCLNHFDTGDPYANSPEQLQGGTLEHQWSNSSFGSYHSSESCFSLQRSRSLPVGTVKSSQMNGLTDKRHKSDGKSGVGELVTRKSYPSERITQLNGSSFQVLSPVSNRDSSYSTVDADENDSGTFDGTQYAKTRRSRARLNYHLDKLRKLLPPPECTSSRKESKSNLIERACKYIAFLQQEMGRQHVIIKQ
ncbi:hypothetical protein GpartN1_g7519.t1 [Galdieria partita]|uniref:BHLH domain-containing protein n=1 Tax=Galdieria partita TaxID=83374 RepID=A0A9C7UUC7_9RHOD|nr:hypothetical protein GpartN1_g7519.t1 [Galdieria partita]